MLGRPSGTRASLISPPTSKLFRRRIPSAVESMPHVTLFNPDLRQPLSCLLGGSSWLSDPHAGAGGTEGHKRPQPGMAEVCCPSKSRREQARVDAWMATVWGPPPTPGQEGWAAGCVSAASAHIFEPTAPPGGLTRTLTAPLALGRTVPVLLAMKLGPELPTQTQRLTHLLGGTSSPWAGLARSRSKGVVVSDKAFSSEGETPHFGA